MAQLTPAFFQTILKIEGGYQNRADDNGNYNSCGELTGTNMGASSVALSQWLGRCVTANEVKNLTQQEAFNFYAWYFNRLGLFAIENQAFFELLANNSMGSPTGAAKVEQRVLNSFGYPVTVDGVRGPITIDALNNAWRMHGPKLYNAIRAGWIEYLHSINKPQFIEGWLYRMNTYFPPLATGTGISLGIALIILITFIGLNKNRA